MGIPLQPINLKSYAQPNPFLSMEQMAAGLQSLALRRHQAKLMQQQADARVPLTQAQAQMMQARANQMAAQQAVYEKYPEAHLGPAGQMVAALHALGGTPPSPQPSQPMAALGGASSQVPDSRVPPPPPPQSASLGAPSGALSTVPHGTATQPVPPPTAQPTQPTHPQPSTAAPDDVPLKSVTQLAQDYINNFDKNLSGVTPESLGLHFADPNKEALAKALLHKQFPQTWADTYRKSQALRAWQTLPVDFRRQEVGKLVGLGMPASTANAYLARGGNPTKLAHAMGLTDQQYQAAQAYSAATGALITKGQEIGLKNHIYSKVSPVAAKWLSPYIHGSIDGISPKMLKQLIFNQGKNGRFKRGDQDNIAKAMAAAAAQMELVGMRLRAADLRSNVPLLNSSFRQAASNLKPFQGLLTPETYRKSQAYLTQFLNLMGQATNEFISNPSYYSKQIKNLPGTPLKGDLGSGQQTTEQTSSPTVHVRFKDGRIAKIPRDALAQAQKEMGAKVIG